MELNYNPEMFWIVVYYTYKYASLNYQAQKINLSGFERVIEQTYQKCYRAKLRNNATIFMMLAHNNINW